MKEATDTRLWRVFYTTPRAEKKAEERLLQQGLEVFLPKRHVIRQWKDRKKKVVEPLFPNYLFAHVEEQERLQVLKTPGIVRAVSFGGALAQVRDDEIEQLKIVQKDPLRLSLIEYLPPVGESVRIVEGPLRGLYGEVTQHRGQTHLILRVTAIQQAVRVQVSAGWVRMERNLRVG